MEKKKVSAFEYAIAGAAEDQEFLQTHEPYTREEEHEMRKQKIRDKVQYLYDNMKKAPQGGKL